MEAFNPQQQIRFVGDVQGGKLNVCIRAVLLVPAVIQNKAVDHMGNRAAEHPAVSGDGHIFVDAGDRRQGCARIRRRQIVVVHHQIAICLGSTFPVNGPGTAVAATVLAGTAVSGYGTAVGVGRVIDCDPAAAAAALGIGGISTGAAALGRDDAVSANAAGMNINAAAGTAAVTVTPGRTSVGTDRAIDG